MKIFIGADHKGFKMKEHIAKWLFDKRHDFTDFGAEFLEEGDDYTVYSERVASMVSDDKNSRGILFCGSGVGVDIASNKFDGVRASIGLNTDQVKAGRNDDDMNILVIAADYTSTKEAEKMVEAFLKTKFSGKIRHKRRLTDIKRIEENN